MSTNRPPTRRSTATTGQLHHRRRPLHHGGRNGRDRRLHLRRPLKRRTEETRRRHRRSQIHARQRRPDRLRRPEQRPCLLGPQHRRLLRRRRVRRLRRDRSEPRLLLQARLHRRRRRRQRRLRKCLRLPLGSTESRGLRRDQVVPDVVTKRPPTTPACRRPSTAQSTPTGSNWTNASSNGGKARARANTPKRPLRRDPGRNRHRHQPGRRARRPERTDPAGHQYHYRLVATNPNATVNGSNQNFTTPDTVTTEAATGLNDTEATLHGTVNPDGATLAECVFEWGPQKGPDEQVQQYPNSAPCVPGPGGITGTSPVAVEAGLSELHAGSTYAYRLKAKYPTGDVSGDPLTAQTAGPVLLASWSQDVDRTEATLKAQINPEGAATDYRIQWGATAAYGNSTEGAVGSDSSVHELSHFLEGLAEGATYHYRVTATNANGTTEGTDHIFNTYSPPSVSTDCPNQANRTGLSAALPDCRAYEMVSPVDKNGADIKTLCNINCNRTALNQASLSGDRITYSSYKAFGDALSNLYSNQYLATRGSSGWSTRSLNPVHGRTPYSPEFDPTWDLEVQFKAFSRDLATSWRTDDTTPSIGTGGVDGDINLFERDTATGNSVAIGHKEPFNNQQGGLALQGISGDGQHAIFQANRPATPDAAENHNSQLYDSSNGTLSLVSVLPGGEPNPTWAFLGLGSSRNNGRSARVENAVSEDGSRIYWTASANGFANPGKIYVRVDGETTIPVSESVSAAAATFWSAAADGSSAFFTIPGEGGKQLPTSSNSNPKLRASSRAMRTVLLARATMGRTSTSCRMKRLLPEARSASATSTSTIMELCSSLRGCLRWTMAKRLE